MTHRILSVAEKPSVAKELGRIIGKGQHTTRNGHSQYNRIYDIGQCEFKEGERSTMAITSVTGHMMEIEFTEQHRGWNSCQPVELFTAPILKSVKGESGANIEKTLIDEARKATVLLLWLDCDLEGENIAFEVVEVCKKANPRIDIYRARFSALIERDIFRTLRYPERPNKHMSDAVDARQEIDLRIGAAFTRFQTLRLQSKYDSLKNQIISYGPCQFPTLGFVVERHLKIASFVPTDFWYISCEYECDDAESRNGKMLCKFSWDRGRLYDRLSCTILFETCVECDGLATVTRCHSNPKSKFRPCPLNTIELQKRASQWQRMASERTMQVAEELYNRGILSYPRTETDYFKEGFDFQPLIQEQCNHSLWGPFAVALDQGMFTWPRNGGHDDQAHPPIHPLKSVELNQLQNDDERKIYELVTRHFLACCGHDAQGQQSTLGIQIPLGGESFSASGLMVTDTGYLKVYTYEKWSDNKIPVFQVGDQFYVKRLQMNDGRTSAPTPLSEVELITQMDQNGIGTDATVATHIKTIQDREYATKDPQNRFIPTKLGVAMVEGYASMGLTLSKHYLRAAMERDCQKIARNEIAKQVVVDKCLEEMKKCFLTANNQAQKLDTALTKHYGAQGVVNQAQYVTRQGSFSKCGVCAEMMDLQEELVGRAGGNGVGQGAQDGQKDRILYCKRCRKGVKLPPKGDLSPHLETCRICHYQVLSVHNSETQKTHTVCPFCFKTPPGPPVSDVISDFRCFACAHETCPLAGKIAGGDVDIALCTMPQCSRQGGVLRLNKAQNGSFKIACTRDKTCGGKALWLPKCCQSVIPLSSDDCPTCSPRLGYPLKLLKIEVNLSKVPRGTRSENVVCMCCSDFWDNVGERTFRLDPLPGGNYGGGGGGGRGGGGGGGGGRGGGFHEGDGGANRGGNAGGGVQRGIAPFFGGVDRRPVLPPPPPAAAAAAAADVSDYGAAMTTGAGFKKPARGGAGRGRGGGGRGAAAAAPQDENYPACKCGETSKKLKTTKAGPNEGRFFYTCPKERDVQCGFFQWVDEEPGSHSGRGGGGGGGGGGAGGQPPICSRCKNSGHWSRDCPQK